MTRLFSGFAPAFYEAYAQAYPLLPGWQARIPVYQLYYLMVHLNLFGRGYWRRIREIIQ